MKIVQVVLSLAWGDAVGNDVIALDRILKELCADTRIYVKWADGKIDKDIYSYIHEMPKLDEDDILENLDSVKIWFDDELAGFVDYSPFVNPSRIGQPFV